MSMLSFMLNRCGCDATNFRTLRQMESLIMEEDSKSMSMSNGTEAEPIVAKTFEHFVAHNETTIDYILEKCDADLNDFPMLTMLTSLLAQDKHAEHEVKEVANTSNATLENVISDVTEKNKVYSNSIENSKEVEINKEEQINKRPPARNGAHQESRIRLTSQKTNQQQSSKDNITCQEYKNKQNDTNDNNNIVRNNMSKAQINKLFTKKMSKYADRYLRSLYDRRVESEDVKQRSPLQRHQRQKQEEQQEHQKERINNHNNSESNDQFQNGNKRHLIKTEQEHAEKEQTKEQEEEQEEFEQIDISNVSAIEHDTLQEHPAENSKWPNEFVIKHKCKQNIKENNISSISNNALHACHETKNNTDAIDTVQHNTTLNFSSSSLSSPQPSQPEQEHSLTMPLELPSNTHQGEIRNQEQSSEVFERNHHSAIAHLLHLSTCRRKLINNFNKHNNITCRSNTPLCSPITSHEQNVRSHVSEPVSSTFNRHVNKYNNNNNNKNKNNKNNNGNGRNNELNEKKTRRPPRVDGSLPTIYNKRVLEALSISPIPVHRCLTDVENDEHAKHSGNKRDSNRNYKSSNVSVDRNKQVVYTTQGSSSQVWESERSKNNEKNNAMHFMQISKTRRQTSANNVERKQTNEGVATGEQLRQEPSNDQHTNHTRMQRPRSTSQTLSSNTSLMQAIPINRNKNINNNCYLINRNKLAYDDLCKNTKEPNLMIVGSTIQFAQCPDKIRKHA